MELRPIKTEKDYRIALKRLEEIFDQNLALRKATS
jgi:antitoxin component HigA of HigAB toxin-antitoxin module